MDYTEIDKDLLKFRNTPEQIEQVKRNESEIDLENPSERLFQFWEKVKTKGWLATLSWRGYYYDLVITVPDKGHIVAYGKGIHQVLNHALYLMRHKKLM